MGRFLSTFFSVVAIPPDLAPSLITSHRSRYAEYLARNHSLAANGILLFSSSLSAGALAELVRARDPQVLDAVLSSKENRDAVLMSVLDYWTLCESDQRRLAQRRLPQNTANRLLSGPYTPATKSLAATYASPGPRLEWLSTLEADDAVMLTHLEALAPALARSPWSVIPVLLSRRSLRHLALHSSHDILKMAACWTELDEPDQVYALEYATSKNLYGSAADPVVGLLTQPALCPDLRRRLTAHQHRERHAPGLIERRRVSTATLWPYSFPEDALPLALRDDPRDLNNLLSQAARMMKFISNPQDQAGSISIYHELSLNPHLNQDQLERLLTGICFHPSMMFDSRSRPLAAALTRATSRLDPTASASEVVERLGLLRALSLSHVPQVLEDATVFPAVSTPRQKNVKWHYYEQPNDSVDALLQLSPAFLSESSTISTGAVEKLSPSFTDLLGDATNPLSIRAWTLFLGLCEGDPDVPLSTIVQSALRLTYAETVPA